jgi:DNA-binding NarL/FixJ family response regulator
MNPAEPITVILADDHPLFLSGVRSTLEKVDFVRVVGEAHTGTSAWELIQKWTPTVAILDLDMPGLDGLQIARRVARQKLPVKLVLLTMHKREELLREAIDLGVLGYLPKDDMAADVVACIKAVVRGDHFIPASLSSLMLKARSLIPPSQTPLSPTQNEVLKLIAKGLSSKEIATEMGISVRTVENHRFRITEKLGLKGNNSLVRYVLENRAQF